MEPWRAQRARKRESECWSSPLLCVAASSVTKPQSRAAAEIPSEQDLATRWIEFPVPSSALPVSRLVPALHRTRGIPRDWRPKRSGLNTSFAEATHGLNWIFVKFFTCN